MGLAGASAWAQTSETAPSPAPPEALQQCLRTNVEECFRGGVFVVVIPAEGLRPRVVELPRRGGVLRVECPEDGAPNFGELDETIVSCDGTGTIEIIIAQRWTHRVSSPGDSVRYEDAGLIYVDEKPFLIVMRTTPHREPVPAPFADEPDDDGFLVGWGRSGVKTRFSRTEAVLVDALIPTFPIAMPRRYEPPKQRWVSRSTRVPVDDLPGCIEQHLADGNLGMFDRCEVPAWLTLALPTQHAKTATVALADSDPATVACDSKLHATDDGLMMCDGVNVVRWFTDRGRTGGGTALTPWTGRWAPPVQYALGRASFEDAAGQHDLVIAYELGHLLTTRMLPGRIVRSISAQTAARLGLVW